MKERELFLSALEINDPTARAEHLKSACAGDVELLARVQSLLDSHEGPTEFLNRPAVEQLADVASEEFDATGVNGNGSTREDDAMHDEIALGYLEPSSKEEGLGRLGHYEVLEVIGRGAFGIVLRALDEKLQRVVAIKVLAPDMAATSPARKRFLREARTSASVRHENVVAVYAVEDKPIPYLVMEYIPGKTLQQRLDEQGPLNVSDALRLGKQIADGLAAAHSVDLIHRDVKPGNILLEGGMDDRVKITDFGLARTVDDASMTQSGLIVGTPLYMAPEQALGRQLDQRADLFSLGSVLYQVISGRPPFRAANTIAVLKRVAEDMARPIQEIIPETPNWMCELIANLHAKNPDERYCSAKEVSQLLAQCLADVEAGQTPNVPRQGHVVDKAPQPVGTQVTSQKAQPWWKNPVAIAAAAVLALLAIFVITETSGVTSFIAGSIKSPPQSPGPSNDLVRKSHSEADVRVKPSDSRVSSFDVLTSQTYEWEEPVNLGPEINSSQQDGDPWISHDGLTLLFSSTRNRDRGDNDIYISTRASIEDRWAAPVNIGQQVNSAGSEGGPQMSADGLELYFHRAPRVGGKFGKMDIWMAKRESIDAPWSEPVNLETLNSPEWDSIPTPYADGLRLLFQSNRNGRWQRWVSTRKAVDQAWSAPLPLPGGQALTTRVQFLDGDDAVLFGGIAKASTKSAIGVSRWSTFEAGKGDKALVPWPMSDKNNVLHPYYCRAGRELFFTSDRLGGQGGKDIWVRRRKAVHPIQRPTPGNGRTKPLD